MEAQHLDLDSFPSRFFVLLSYTRSMTKHVYIDGQNFMYKAADVLISAGRIASKDELTKIDIRGLIENITGEGVAITYYGAKVRVRNDLGDDIREKTTRFSDVSRRIRGTLQAQRIDFNESGKLKVRDSDRCHNCNNQDYRMQEKGVDVGIAVDMVEAALTRKVDEHVLISSDTDLIPAIKVVKAAGSSVVYVGFSNKTTNAIIAKADKTEIIRDQEIVDAYDRLNPQKLGIE